ncbi:hypothetical protein E1B28_010111 [Marasmius oreades]|uniref:Uncharacterized protein n=1 Tax=Marasmius oreades TaxID=181124 RepID=A0A9P7UTB6_9AGAR|nr:uncharacterized protein E1B28_010111 [Marasmius oreades]KAG7091054.1 hypothetical protein E1B28_010111 [Marasmius oreades]
MSALGSGEVLKPLLIRSSTPASNEKVLKYLEGMSSVSHEEMANSRPTSVLDYEGYKGMRGGAAHSGVYSPRSQASQLRDFPETPIGHLRSTAHKREDGDEDDANSLEQERSEGGTVLPVLEPGPHDPPGPHYESFDSGPSFGNMGVLPSDDFSSHSQNIHTYPTMNNQLWADDTTKTGEPWTQDVALSGTGLTPAFTKVPLPESVASPRVTSVVIGVESPSTKTRASQSKSSHKTSENGQSPSVAGTRSKTSTERPLSPLSRGSARTKETSTVRPDPPLPESRVGESRVGESRSGDFDWVTYESPASPTRSRVPTRSKAPSVSPSDSLSQVRTKAARKEGSARNEVEVNGAEFSPRSGTRQIHNGSVRPPMSAGGSHQSRPFSPYRHAPTNEDLLHAAIRGRALVIPEEKESEKAPSHAPSKSPSKAASAAPSGATHKTKSEVRTEVRPNGKSPSKAPSVATRRTTGTRKEGTMTPTPSRIRSPDLDELNQEEARIVEKALALATRTPRTSYYSPSAVDAEIAQSNFHDMDLCILLNQLKAPTTHELVKKVILKAVKQRMRKLRMAYDNEYQKTHHNHDPPIVQHEEEHTDEPPKWAADLKREILLMQQRIESLGPKIENLRPIQTQSFGEPSKLFEGDEEYTQTHTPVTQTVNIHTQATGTMAESVYQPGTDIIIEDDHIPDEGVFENEEAGEAVQERFFAAPMSDQYLLENERDDSPGQQLLEEELYKLRQRPSKDGAQETTWDLRRSDADDEDYDRETAPAVAPTIPGSEAGGYPDHRASSPPLPDIPPEASNRSVVSLHQQPWVTTEYQDPHANLPPWQKIHQRLLSWAIIWPLSEIEEALNSTTRGHQVNEVALSIWSTQTYKRYVRSRMTDTPQGVVDRLFVPPNMADAISNAVFNGRHGDACGMLRDLWGPFGLQGMPRLLVVLAKHRSDENHWVVHR